MILENNTLWIRNARLSFPQLLVAKASQGGATPKFSASFIMQPDSPEWAEALQIIGAMATEKWKDRAGQVLNVIAQDKRLRCYGVGSEKTNKETGEIFEGYTDNVVWISASQDTKPQLCGADAQELPPTSNANQMFVGGNWVDGVVSFWLQDNEFGRGVRANLVGVQYLREGEHFGAESTDATGIFQPVPGAPATTAAAPGVPVAPIAFAPAAAPVAAAPAAVSLDFL